jgi:uncharacterized membrane protein
MTTPSEGIFDLITGLPVHPLIIHLVVVMVPLSVLFMCLAIFLPRVRKVLTPIALAFAGIAAASAVIAERSGVALQERVGPSGLHGEQGIALTPVVIMFTVASFVWAFAARGKTPLWRWLSRILAITLLGLGVAAIVLTVLAGHSGAELTWGNRVG